MHAGELLYFFEISLSQGEKRGKWCITEFTEISLYSTFGYTLSNTHKERPSDKS